MYRSDKKKGVKKVDAIFGGDRVFVRSLVELDLLIAKYAGKATGNTKGKTSSKSMTGLSNDLRFIQKQAMLRSALPKAYAGSIDIKDVLARLNN